MEKTAAEILRDIEGIRSGGRARLSTAHITQVIVDMDEAKRSLSEGEFEEVGKLYADLCRCDDELDIGLGDYAKAAVQLIKLFDSLAPYEKYCGEGGRELLRLLPEIRELRRKQWPYGN